MEQYKNIGGDSNVSAYEIGDDFIRVKFLDEAIYLYTYGSADSNNIEEMKKLAQNGEGLNDFINTAVRKKYAQREHQRVH